MSQSCLDYALIAKESKIGKWTFDIVEVNEVLGVNTDHKLLKVTGEVTVIRKWRCENKAKPSFKNEDLNDKYKRVLHNNLQKMDRKREKYNCAS